jgi:hypothetical protein
MRADKGAHGQESPTSLVVIITTHLRSRACGLAIRFLVVILRLV